MKLKVLCDCDDNKVCMGNWDGEPIWHYKTAYDIAPVATPYSRLDKEERTKIEEWFKDEAYKQNSD